jgi:hypothetical protein
MSLEDTQLIPGRPVIYQGAPAIIFDVAADGFVLHFLDDKGETIMREAQPDEVSSPQTGHPRTHVTYQDVIPFSEVRRANWDEMPASRRPRPEE